MKDIKIVRTLHNTVLWNKWKSIGGVVEKFMHKRKANISTSNMITCTYQKEFGFDSNIKLIYNGFTAISQQAYPYIYSGKINVLFAGRFVPQKGIPVLINIIKRVDEKVFYFHIAGKGPLEEIILQELGNKSNVRITPPIFSLAQYLSSFDYVFIPSEHEGLNSLSIESSINKVPVIINDIDGLNETLPQNYPLKVKNNCIDEYMTLFTDVIPTIDRVSLIDSVYQYSCQKFDIQQMQKQYEYIYKTGKKYGCCYREK
jgi:glycosyltransferase involved in cell wall biosynthesis